MDGASFPRNRCRSHLPPRITRSASLPGRAEIAHQFGERCRKCAEREEEQLLGPASSRHELA